MKPLTKLFIVIPAVFSIPLGKVAHASVAENFPTVSDAHYSQFADRIESSRRKGDVAGEVAIADAVMNSPTGSVTDDQYIRLVDYAMQAIGNSVNVDSNATVVSADTVYKAGLMRKYALQAFATGRVTPAWTMDYYSLLTPADECDGISGRDNLQVYNKETTDHLALLLQGYNSICASLSGTKSFAAIGQEADTAVVRHLSITPENSAEIAAYGDLEAGRSQVNDWIAERELQANYARYMQVVIRLKRFSGVEGRKSLAVLLKQYVADPAAREKLEAGMLDHPVAIRATAEQPQPTSAGVPVSTVQDIKPASTTASLEEKEQAIKAILAASPTALSEDNFENLAYDAIAAIQSKSWQPNIRVAYEDADTVQINDLRRTYALQALTTHNVSPRMVLNFYALTRNADDYDYASKRVSRDAWRSECLQHLTLLIAGYNSLCDQVEQAGSLSDVKTGLDDAYAQYGEIPSSDTSNLRDAEVNIKIGKDKVRAWFDARKMKCTYASELMQSVPQRYFTSQEDLSELTPLLQEQIKDKVFLSTLLNQVSKQSEPALSNSKAGKAA